MPEPTIERVLVRGELVLRVEAPEDLDYHRDHDGYLAETVNTYFAFRLESRIRKAERQLLKRWRRINRAVSKAGDDT